MDVENSRRSACDRCRGQKLRCVRPLGTTPSADDPTLEPCERCVKAGAECVSTLSTLRKITRDGRFSGTASPSRSQSDHTSLQPLFPKAIPYSQTSAGNSSIGRGEGALNDNVQQKPPSESDYPTRIELQDQCPSRPRKRRQTNEGHIPFRVEDFNDTHSHPSGYPDALSFGTTKGPSFLQNGPPNLNLSSFSLPPIPESCAKPSDTTSMMDVLFEPVSSAGSCASTTRLDANRGDTNATMEAQAGASREDQLHHLSELNSRILRDFKGVNSIAVADIVSSLTRCEPESQARTIESTVPQSPIGRVLESSQVFLELLQGLRPDPYSYAESDCSYSEYRDETELPHLSSDDQLFSDMTTRDPITYLNNDMITPVSQPPSSVPPIDMPMTLIILTCYTLLLQTYETIFSRIQEFLCAHEKLSGRLIPPVLPGLHIGGFYLHKHRDLQMEILISISCKMLERIEEVLGINVISEPQDPAPSHMSQRRGLLDTSYASDLLDVLFKQVDPYNSQNYRGERVAMVKQTMESIRHVFKHKY